MTSDIKAPTQGEAIARPEATGSIRGWRVLASTGALILMLVAGWVAGVKTHETIDVAQISSTAWKQVATLADFVQSAGAHAHGRAEPGELEHGAEFGDGEREHGGS